MQTNDINERLASEKEEEIIEPPQVVVKFRDEIELTYADDIGDELDQKFDKAWSRLKDRFPTISIKRLFTSVEPDRIQDLVARAKQKAQQKDRDYAPPNFLTYFIVEYEDGKDPAALASALSDLVDIVEESHVVPKPAPSPNADPIFFYQNFLNPNEEGVHAAYGWAITGGNGDNIRLIDMEKGWDSHTDIPLDINSALINGSDNSFERDHGTKVLGVILARDSGTHCKCGPGTDCECSGIAKNAITNLVSEWRTTPELRNKKADAIMAAISFLAFDPDSEGSVLLIESQSDLAVNDPDLTVPPNFYPSTGYAPIEVYKAEFDAIELATNSNIVVIEAAGNSVRLAPNQYDAPVDLDSVEKRFGPSPGQKILNRTDPGLKDSGAIIVGAGTWMVEHQRTQRPALASSETTNFGDVMSGIPTNYGSRIDCYAWGEYVTTTNTGNIYGTSFDGTSSASAIIAGVALVVQGIAKAHNRGDNINKTYGPLEMRRILSTYGTPSRNSPNPDQIGIMPDLERIIDEELHMSPDAFLRDNLLDTGNPHAGPSSSSPDIILCDQQVSSFQTFYTSNQESDGLGQPIRKNGNTKYIYVRVKNRGKAVAQNVQVTVYWSKVSALPIPAQWIGNSIGTVTIPTIPGGMMQIVEIPWPDSAIPQPGTYSFVGIIGTTKDPAPSPLAINNWTSYRSFVRDNKNVTRCNFRVDP